MTKEQYKDMIWHGFKALICGLQLWLLNVTANQSTATLLDFLTTDGVASSKGLAYLAFIYPAEVIALYIALWWYYDSIDDRSFDRFCAAEKTPAVLLDQAYQTEIVLAVLTATPILTISLYTPFMLIGLRQGEAIAVSIFVALIFTAAHSLIRVKRLSETWAIQKTLRTGNEKNPKVIKRVIYAIIYFIALNMLMKVGLMVVMFLGSFLVALARLLLAPAGIAAVLLFLWFGVFKTIRMLRSRVKFMKRLRRMRDKGELSFTIHGHPYLSVFSTRILFGLTIVDAPHPDGRVRTDTTYQVAFANCRRRRFTVVLTDGHVYRFVYTLQFNMIARYGRMGAAVGSSGGRVISVPGASWYTNHAFEFPEGEGKRILLVDPTPHILAIHGARKGELIELDNSSKIYDYTVFGKNSFLNLLERI